MPRRTRHRRRFHTDRIVAARRARYMAEEPPWWTRDLDLLGDRLAYGRLAQADPWDCGRARCGICHTSDPSRRAREQRAWRRVEAAAWR